MWGKLCWTKVREAACCYPCSLWCRWRCSQKTFSLAFEESGPILSFQYLALEKVLVVRLSFVLDLGIKWEMWILIFFSLQQQRYPGGVRTGTSLFSDQHSISRCLLEMILNVESAEQSLLTGKLTSVRQQIRVSAKCLKLWEKSILSNETAARPATRHPFEPTQQESFFTSLHMTNRESSLHLIFLG